MKEVILNDECIHCNDRECHDGEHFCNQAMKENSFYKNAKLYKGLEVIQRPTYEELEKENAELKADNDARKSAMAMSEKVEKQLREENAELRKTVLQFQKDSYCGLCHFKTKAQLTKATEIIIKLKALYFSPVVTKDDIKRQDEILAEVEQFLSEVGK